MRRQTQWAFWVGLIVVVGAGGILAAGLYRSTFLPPDARLQGVLASALDENFNPVSIVENYTPDDTFYISIRIRSVPSHSVVTARWHYEGSLIASQDQSIGSASEWYVLGFELARTDGPWPVGDYWTEILLNGEGVGSIVFSVAEPE